MVWWNFQIFQPRFCRFSKVSGPKLPNSMPCHQSSGFMAKYNSEPTAAQLQAASIATMPTERTRLDSDPEKKSHSSSLYKVALYISSKYWCWFKSITACLLRVGGSSSNLSLRVERHFDKEVLNSKKDTSLWFVWISSILLKARRCKVSKKHIGLAAGARRTVLMNPGRPDLETEATSSHPSFTSKMPHASE